MRGCAGLFDFLEQCRGEFAREFLIGVGDQGIDAAEMMIEQADGDPGLGGDAPYRNPGMTVAAQAAQGGGHQQFATLVRLGAAVFRGGGCHRRFLGSGSTLASLVERVFNLQSRRRQYLDFSR
ncbi:hypothetical protein PMm318_A41900 [Pseudomonas moorei]